MAPQYNEAPVPFPLMTQLTGIERLPVLRFRQTNVQSAFFPQRAAAASFPRADLSAFERVAVPFFTLAKPPFLPMLDRYSRIGSGVALFFAMPTTTISRDQNEFQFLFDTVSCLWYSDSHEIEIHFRFLPHLQHAVRAPSGRVRRRRRLRPPRSAPLCRYHMRQDAVLLLRSISLRRMRPAFLRRSPRLSPGWHRPTPALLPRLRSRMRGPSLAPADSPSF